jgi:hypothetical protein
VEEDNKRTCGGGLRWASLEKKLGPERARMGWNERMQPLFLFFIFPKLQIENKKEGNETKA